MNTRRAQLEGGQRIPVIWIERVWTPLITTRAAVDGSVLLKQRVGPHLASPFRRSTELSLDKTH